MNFDFPAVLRVLSSPLVGIAAVSTIASVTWFALLARDASADETAGEPPAAEHALPPIDLEKHERVETATFALG